MSELDDLDERGIRFDGVDRLSVGIPGTISRDEPTARANFENDLVRLNQAIGFAGFAGFVGTAPQRLYDLWGKHLWNNRYDDATVLHVIDGRQGSRLFGLAPDLVNIGARFSITETDGILNARYQGGRRLVGGDADFHCGIDELIMRDRRADNGYCSRSR